MNEVETYTRACAEVIARAANPGEAPADRAR